MFARKFIPTGTELTYDYDFEWFGGDKVACLCGAPNCSGFLGANSKAFVVRPHGGRDAREGDAGGFFAPAILPSGHF